MKSDNNLNFIVNEPPLKKIRRQMEELANSIPEISHVNVAELSSASLKVQLQEDANLISGDLIEIVTEFLFFTFFYVYFIIFYY